MKWVFSIIVATLFLAIPVATASYYVPYHHSPHHSPHYHTSGYGGADIVFRGEVTRIQRIGGSNPRVEVTFRVRERIRGNPSTTIVLTFPRHRDHWGRFYDHVPLQQSREYVIGARRVDSRYRLVWFEPATQFRPPVYHPPVHHRPPTGVTIPNPHTTNTCTVVDVAGRIVVVCPSSTQPGQAQPRFEPLAIGDPQPVVTTAPRVPIAAFPWLH